MDDRLPRSAVLGTVNDTAAIPLYTHSSAAAFTAHLHTEALFTVS
jgi:hypothetical protein